MLRHIRGEPGRRCARRGSLDQVDAQEDAEGHQPVNRCNISRFSSRPNARIKFPNNKRSNKDLEGILPSSS